MRKAFDANVPKLKPRLRPAYVVASDTAPETQDESITNLSKEPTDYSVVPTAAEEVSKPDSANISEPLSTENNLSTAVTDEYSQVLSSPQIKEKGGYVSHSDRHEAMSRNIVQFPTTTLNKEDNEVGNSVDSLEPCIPQTKDVPLKDQSTISTVMATIQTTDTADGNAQSDKSLNNYTIDTQSGIPDNVLGQSTVSSPVAMVLPLDDDETRRRRLENVKRKVADAVRPEVRIDPVPEDPGLAVESVLGLVSDLEAQLSRSRELEKSLRNELAEAKAELTRTVTEGRTASGRLVQAEAQLDDKRKVLEEMLFEMGALEEERDQAVRMVQVLTAKDKERQLELDDLGRRCAEMQRTLDESKVEEERLNGELDDYNTENNRLHTLLTEITRERDTLLLNVEQLIKERNELTEAKRALEKVHNALSQARARLRE